MELIKLGQKVADEEDKDSANFYAIFPKHFFLTNTEKKIKKITKKKQKKGKTKTEKKQKKVHPNSLLQCGSAVVLAAASRGVITVLLLLSPTIFAPPPRVLFLLLAATALALAQATCAVLAVAVVDIVVGTIGRCGNDGFGGSSFSCCGQQGDCADATGCAVGKNSEDAGSRTAIGTWNPLLLFCC